MNFDVAQQHLLGDGSDAMIAFMASQSVIIKKLGDTSAAKAKAVEFGWLDPTTGKPSVLGVMVSDSCREYMFWQQRGRALPFENALPQLGRATFEGKYIAEIGAGMGANLMSLTTTDARLCGVEPVDTYVRLGDIFRIREGMQPIEMRAGGAEALPFAANELDLVLLVSAHQYFEVHVALEEIARVIKPGGELILIGGTLPDYIKEIGSKVIVGKSSPKAFLMTVANTLGYMALGRRVIPSRGGFSTSRPIYPTRAAMTRWMRAVGFEQVVSPDRIGFETCFYAKLSDD